MPVKRFYREPGLGSGAHEVVVSKIQKVAGQVKVNSVKTEVCFYVDVPQGNDITSDENERLLWLLGTPFEEGKVSQNSFLQDKASPSDLKIEIGPRLNFSTAFSTNAVSMCHSIDLEKITRIEFSTRYLISFKSDPKEAGDGVLVKKETELGIVAALHDRMTQCRYTTPLSSFALTTQPDEVFEVDVLGQGRPALEKANAELGLAFDDWDLDYYTKMFRDQVKRNPTSVECFDLAQSNSEHSRHWFFKGRMVVDGTECNESLFQMVMDTQKHSNQNNTIKFSDNSSAIKGFSVRTLCPEKASEPGPFTTIDGHERNIIFTAETHNFPTGVAPFPGATTGTGGRIRDVQATGRGARVVAGTAGYCFGNLHIPGYDLPWEDKAFEYPPNFASGLEVAIEASNGASDYGNKFGEPVLAGFARSCGLRLPGGERREWVKPIMFSGGIGSMDARHSQKEEPEVDMVVVKVGGPVYRIGVGGGAASSIQVQGDNEAQLDFGAVQRGDAEMEQKMNRIIRACVERREGNPICSIHDQGAGGNGNVLKEICEPLGAEIQVGAFRLGDPTLSVLELWGAEYQESNAMLVRPEHQTTLTKIGLREKCDVSFVGRITGDGKIRLVDDRNATGEEKSPEKKKIRRECQHPVDLELEYVLGSMPRKVFNIDRLKPSLSSVSLPVNLTVQEALYRVLRLPAVASKRYLTNKVDRCVTGLVAQQQCVGPLHTPLADVAVTALSYFDTVGSATSIGEQPIKGLVDPGCGARMSVGEALTNLVWAPITDIKDVKCSGNWMWAAKLPGEGATLVDTCQAMCDVMAGLGVAVDGGKDSLSMAARVGKDTVKAPGALVISTYAPCVDITAVVTPDLKCPAGKGSLVYVPLGGDKHRLGGSALAQCYGQVGDVAPDLDSTDIFVKAFNVTQKLIKAGKVMSGHDVSDGGLVTCILEMAFAGNCGLKVDLPFSANVFDVLFAEELGLVMEVASDAVDEVTGAFSEENVQCLVIGHSVADDKSVSVSVNGHEVLTGNTAVLRDVWEETSVQLERLQTNPHCAQQEAELLKTRETPKYHLSFSPDELLKCDEKAPAEAPRVAVIREEGSNGDREMAAAFHMAGFQAWDVNMQDLCSGRISLKDFRGVVFVGGFSYADVCGSAKGWAATMKYNDQVRAEFAAFYERSDTFSLGVCNGCQLMALLGWVAPAQDKDQGVLLTHNTSERFESRFSTVKIEESPAMMLRGMAGSTLGVWVAHGEGRVQFKNDTIKENVTSQGLAPIKYVDDAGQPTETYPLNPNGSPGGVAALCSADGRHLAMMPHPERCSLPWQWAWMPAEWAGMKTSPWLCLFRNAYKWCLEN